MANILHGSANPIGGKTVVIKLRWGVKKAEDLLFQGALPGIKFALGENVKRAKSQDASAAGSARSEMGSAAMRRNFMGWVIGVGAQKLHFTVVAT